MRKLYEIFNGEELRIADLILRRRLQMLVHSYLYYEMNTNLISDKQFDTWGRELVKLQQDYPRIAKIVDYADDFSDWDASTGAFLPLHNEEVIRMATRLLRIHTQSNEVYKPVQTVTKPKQPVKRRLF